VRQAKEISTAELMMLGRIARGDRQSYKTLSRSRTLYFLELRGLVDLRFGRCDLTEAGRTMLASLSNLQVKP